MFKRLFEGRSERCRGCGLQIPQGERSDVERRHSTPWCRSCLDLLVAEKRNREERERNEARDLVRRWLDNAPTYEPTHPARDWQRHEALWDQQLPPCEPLVHVLDFDDAQDALTELRLQGSQLSDREWPAPFPENQRIGLISFEDRALREFDRLAADPYAAVPGHLDALYRLYLSGSATSMEARQTTYIGSVYRSWDRIHVVWVEALREIVYG
ncbi:hypothetical protein [Micromonospora foliorum]|uniref:hypothetical protein n=1 Tax=Micromonospora foliorum TaxID=2911210 RepID=UPI001EE8CEEF|nr:hypothetical protein [Micromonospora foliorum]MCG5440729.1 hypothetical protein [Micromonospora foliorum]